MGMFDDALKNAVPGGNFTKPLVIAAGALILSKWMSGNKAADAAQPEIMPPTRAPQPAPQQYQPQTIDVPDHAIPGGLGGLLDKLRNGGLADAANSWVGTGANQPVTPGGLSSALGKTTVSELAQKAGTTEADILDILTQVLPQLVDKLTPNGRVPTPQEASVWGKGG